ncbi:hypothetical protein CYMTET_2840 [Cymbomonas tetramitiformis]|uniref:Uncharacterized protein n=1 Tax=Cymbomonas tetramitiformis TaxID=36881 RepID=A0AAE0LLE6_9CHLO|nr:hypothetical protein CYMTET_2840 [Cymbomonas tetramitiformis]
MCDRIPLFLGANVPNYVGYENKKQANDTDMVIANARLCYLRDSTEPPSFAPAYVILGASTINSPRALINQSSKHTIDLIQYALNSPLFSFGNLDAATNFNNWENDLNFCNDQNEKWLPWDIFQTIKKTYMQLQSKAHVYTDITSLTFSVYKDPIDSDAFVDSGKVAVCIWLYAPLLNAEILHDEYDEEEHADEEDA